MPSLLGGEELARAYVLVGELVAIILEGSGHKPPVLGLEQLVDPHLMALAAVLEAGVIDQVSATVLSGNDRVVALRQLAVGHVAPARVGTEDLHATVRMT